MRKISLMTKPKKRQMILTVTLWFFLTSHNKGYCSVLQKLLSTLSLQKQSL